jgi:hypothetical protein
MLGVDEVLDGDVTQSVIAPAATAKTAKPAAADRIFILLIIVLSNGSLKTKHTDKNKYKAAANGDPGEICQNML